MIFISVCSGIEAASCAWHPLGWRAFAFSEIEAFPSAVLAHHYPNVPNLGDMTKFKEWPDADVDVLVGGTPCQSFSVAGLRKGLADPRGNLMLTYLAIADKYRPRWLVWENVPGVLSSNGGRDFGTFLGGLAELGYGFAYRVLDAQFFGVAQRRRRVFVVGHLGDWRRAAAVLFERHSLQGNPAPRRKAGEGFAHPVAPCLGASGRGFERGGETRGQDPVVAVAPTLAGTANGGGANGPGRDVDSCESLICMSSGQANAEIAVDRSPTINCLHEAPIVANALRGEGFDASEDGTGRSMGHADSHQNGGGHLAVMTLAIRGRGDSHDLECREDGTANALLTPNGGRGGIGVGAVAFAQNTRDEVREMPYVGALAAEPGMKQQSYIRQSMQVRRLTPRECERLQGFPDDYTFTPYRNKPAADGPRYKALGNSMAVPVMRWIGQRIQMVGEACQSKEAA